MAWMLLHGTDGQGDGDGVCWAGLGDAQTYPGAADTASTATMA